MIWSLMYLPNKKFKDRPYNRIFVIFETGVLFIWDPVLLFKLSCSQMPWLTDMYSSTLNFGTTLTRTK